jgi:steroid 5-alpha reductase family enzyme
MLESLVPAALVCAAVITLCWVLSLLFREYSWTDRAWALFPPVYAWIFAAQGDWHPRGVLMAVLVTAWGARLTYNYWRKGGFAPGGEDYRWAILKAKMSPVAWHLFNISFIAGYQNVLVFLITLPAWVVATMASPPALGPADLVLGLLFAGALFGEWRSDQDQWNFHQRKKAGPVDPPFCTEGLFRYSRHPNFFFEQSQWWILFLFPVALGMGVWHVGAVGAPLLTALFWGSTVFTESITASKYPSYKDYQRRVSVWVPMPARGGPQG